MTDGRFFQLIDEDYVKTLPVRCFEGTIYLIDDQEKLRQVKKIIRKEKILGFDTETKPSFTKGRFNNVAMLQLAGEKNAFLFRLNKISLPGFIVEILENPDIVKVGVAIKDALKSLCKIKPFTPAGFIELQEYSKITVLKIMDEKVSSQCTWFQNIKKKKQTSIGKKGTFS
jgi:ribonuclease D